MRGQTELTIRADAGADGVVLRLAGEVDLSTQVALREALAEAAGGGGCITIDAADLVFMDSAGVGALVSAIDLGVGVRVVRPQPVVQRVLEVLAVDGLVVEA